MPFNWLKRVAEGLFINGLYDVMKVLLIGGLTGLAVALWQYLKHWPIDWWGILSLFLFVLVLSTLLLRLHRQQPEPDSGTEANQAGSISAFDSRSDLLMSDLSTLQQDALHLSSRLLDFIKEQGDPPEPKYTAQQIHAMSSEQVKQRILANDKDFEFACEYHFGGQEDVHLGTNTAEKLEKKIMMRITVLDPWYDKVRAKFELEYREQVERMYNRFCVEGLCDDDLKTPVQGRTSRETVRDIAATLWELAFKLKEKEVAIKQEV
jgi:hypothetical protein